MLSGDGQEVGREALVSTSSPLALLSNGELRCPLLVQVPFTPLLLSSHSPPDLLLISSSLFSYLFDLGSWPALWFCAINGVWPPEIDQMEMFGSSTNPSSHLHLTFNGQDIGPSKYPLLPPPFFLLLSYLFSGFADTSGTDYSKAFHIWTIDMQATGIYVCISFFCLFPPLPLLFLLLLPNSLVIIFFQYTFLL